MISIPIPGRPTTILTPDGPHCPDTTRELAGDIDAAFRLLNYATQKPGGLRYPADVYGVLGELAAAIAKMPQALEQMGAWITAQVAAGAVQENPHYGRHQGDAGAAARELRSFTVAAGEYAGRLAEALRHAQSATAGLEYAGPDLEDDQ